MTSIRFLSCSALAYVMLWIWPAAGQVLEPQPPDVRLVIDVSGSMKRNDPNNLRQPAVDLLVQLLPKDSKAGVWTFGRWVNMLVEHRPVDDKWRQDALAKSDQINSAGLFTNIGEALEKAAYDIQSLDKKHRRSIILLTDGMVDIDKDPERNKREWRRIVDEILPRLGDSGVAIHTIALSENADTDLLNKLSIATDGITAVAKNAEDLMQIFLKAFDVAAPMEQVPLSEEGFVIDSSVEEFTALIFRQDSAEKTQLIGPDNEVLTVQSTSKYVNWYRDEKYDLITVKQPLEGQWQVLASMEPQSRVTVVSNLNLRVKPLLNNILQGYKGSLSFLLQEDGKTITSPEFLSLMTISADIIAGRDEFELTQFWQQDINTKTPPADGVFTLPLPEFSQEGIYQLSLMVDGKSFVREFNHQFATRQPFGADLKEQVNDGKMEYVLTVRAYAKEVNVGKTKVVVTIASPDERKKIRPLTATDLDTWQTMIRPEIQGQYKASIRTRGEYKDGSPFDSALEAIDFNYSLESGFVEQEKPFLANPSPTPIPPIPVKPEVTPVSANKSLEKAADSAVEPLPAWMLYLALGLGNLLLFALGFLAYKKIMRSGAKEDILEQFSEDKLEEEIQSAQEEEEKSVDTPSMEEDEEEPPMEDIDPEAYDDGPTPMTSPISGEPQAAMDEEVEAEENESSAPAELEMPMPASDAIELESEASDNAEEDTGALDALDDLDQMAVEAEQASDPPEKDDAPTDEDTGTEDEEEDMVSAMLKAQGLDLAEDELDDAISSLIDELENDGTIDESDDDKKES